MKIKKLILENFRIFKEKTVIDLDNLTAFIGKNDVGKSTILDALNIFFNGRDAQGGIDKEDLSQGADSNEVYIGVVFDDFPDKIVIDSTVSTSLKEEYLINKDGLLEIFKIYPNGDLKKEKTYIRANHPINEELKDLLKLKIQDLKKRAEELGIDLSGEDKRKASVIRKAIRRNFNNSIELDEVTVAIDEEGMKQIWEQIKNYLPLYALFKSDRQNVDKDNEIQDPMKIAIKKVLKLEELQEKFNEIHRKVVSEITLIANQTIEKLREMNPEIAQELKPEIEEPKWENVFKGISISSDEGIRLNKRGSGVRRLILLSFFRAEAEKQKEQRGVPDIIYAFEEPEASQHPDHQMKLIEAFLSLAERGDTQIILTTHSPGIAQLLPVENIRFLEKEGNKISIDKGSDEVLEKIAKSLGVLPSIEIENAKRLKLIICVEGPTDVEFLIRLAKIIDEDLKIDFKNDPRVVVIPLGGSTLKFWVDNHYLRKLGLPEIHIYDRDKRENINKAEVINQRGDGSKAFITNKLEMENYVHPKILEDIFRELTENTLIDRQKPDWVSTWGELDVVNQIKNNGVALREGRIKEKICTEGMERMSVELLDEIGASEEIRGWFSYIQEIISN